VGPVLTLTDTTSYRCSARLCATDDNTLSSAIQPVLNPPGQGPVQPALGDPASAGGLD